MLLDYRLRFSRLFYLCSKKLIQFLVLGLMYLNVGIDPQNEVSIKAAFGKYLKRLSKEVKDENTDSNPDIRSSTAS